MTVSFTTPHTESITSKGLLLATAIVLYQLTQQSFLLSERLKSFPIRILRSLLRSCLTLGAGTRRAPRHFQLQVCQFPGHFVLRKPRRSTRRLPLLTGALRLRFQSRLVPRIPVAPHPRSDLCPPGRESRGHQSPRCIGDQSVCSNALLAASGAPPSTVRGGE